MSPRTHNFLGIQYLRGIAAMLVVLFHVCESRQAYFVIGSGGVDIFFVISGFVMWITTVGRHLSFGGFMLRRIERLVPLYWLVTLASAAAMAVKPQFFYGVSYSMANLIRSLLFIPYYNDTQEAWPIVLQGWTLNIEMFFYLLFGLTLLLPQGKRLQGATAFMAGLVALRLCLHPQSALFHSWCDPLLLELLSGLWLGKAYTDGKLQTRPYGPALMTAGIAGFALMHAIHYEHSLWRAAELGLPAFALVAGCVMTELNQGIPRLRVLEYFGNASYSLYLWHNLLLVSTGALLLRLHIMNDPLKAAIELFVCVAGSLLAYQFLEKPLTCLLKKTRKKPAN